MEYNFSVTRRLLAIFMICSCLFVACIFFLGFEFGKKMSAQPINGLTGLKTEITQKNGARGSIGVSHEGCSCATRTGS